MNFMNANGTGCYGNLDPKLTAALTEAVELRSSGRIPEALRAFEKLLDAHPNFGGALFDYGQLLAQLGDDRGYAFMKRAAKSKDLRVLPETLIRLVEEMKLGDRPDPKILMGMLVDGVNPDLRKRFLEVQNSVAQEHLAIFPKQTGPPRQPPRPTMKRSKALERSRELHDALARDPMNPDAIVALAAHQVVELQDVAAGTATLEAAVSAGVKSAKVCIMLANTLLDQLRTRDAIVAFGIIADAGIPVDGLVMEEFATFQERLFSGPHFVSDLPRIQALEGLLSAARTRPSGGTAPPKAAAVEDAGQPVPKAKSLRPSSFQQRKYVSRDDEPYHKTAAYGVDEVALRQAQECFAEINGPWPSNRALKKAEKLWKKFPQAADIYFQFGFSLAILTTDDPRTYDLIRAAGFCGVCGIADIVVEATNRIFNRDRATPGEIKEMIRPTFSTAYYDNYMVVWNAFTHVKGALRQYVELYNGEMRERERRFAALGNTILERQRSVKAAYDANPRKAPAVRDWAYFLLNTLQDPEGALQVLQEATKNGVGDPMILCDIADLHGDFLDDPREGLKTYEAAILRSPVDARMVRARYMMVDDRWHVALLKRNEWPISGSFAKPKAPPQSTATRPRVVPPPTAQAPAVTLSPVAASPANVTAGAAGPLAASPVIQEGSLNLRPPMGNLRADVSNAPPPPAASIDDRSSGAVANAPLPPQRLEQPQQQRHVDANSGHVEQLGTVAKAKFARGTRTRK